MTSGPLVAANTEVRLVTYPPAARFGPRTLIDHEFVWILRGSAVRELRGQPGTELALQPGQLVLGFPGTTDSYQWDPHRETVHAYVHFSVIDPRPLPPRPWTQVRSMARLPALDGLCSYLLDLAGELGDDRQTRSDHFLGVLLDLFVTGPVARVEVAMSPIVAAALAVVRREWHGERRELVPMAVSALAAGAGVSAGHLFRVFRAEYGLGPARVLEAVRLARAATLLQRSNATLAEVAHRCGFANPYHFSRRFSAAYGRPPGEFRAQGEGLDPYQQLRSTGLLPVAQALLEG